ncbi:MAG: NAD(P)-dependent dehydrogenase (short-subunit alcohol dehydrogenase family) [Acidimicrobiales bacterium]|jgi:NAD(P)-dependent dehydrogenase (short-subunit alcohol dehydrogenase family)
MGMLDGKVGIITGAGRGLGRSHALLMASEGASVVVNDLGGEWDGAGSDDRAASETAADIVGMGANAVANFDDVADWEGAQNMINQAVETYGRLDFLVCNAGFVRDRIVFNMSEAEWDSVVRVHLKGHFVPTRWAAAYWREQSKLNGEPVTASIVYTASEAGLFGNPGQPNYAAAKAGIAGLGITVARELKRYGVRVNTINPRARTRMTVNTFGADQLTANEGDFDVNDPDNVSPWVAYLCTDDAADITGETFVCGGDQVQLMQGWKRENRIRKSKDRWTVAELAAAKAELFSTRTSDE